MKFSLIQSLKSQDTFSSFFKLTIWFKIFYGISKVLLAIFLLKWIAIDPANFFFQLMSHELIEDPNDLFIKLASPMLTHFSRNTTNFVAFYLLFWGIIDDIFLSINILREKLWAFPVALVLIGIFVPYELCRVFHTHSLMLVWIIIVDILVFWMLIVEYRKRRRKLLSNWYTLSSNREKIRQCLIFYWHNR